MRYIGADLRDGSEPAAAAGPGSVVTGDCAAVETLFLIISERDKQHKNVLTRLCLEMESFTNHEKRKK